MSEPVDKLGVIQTAKKVQKLFVDESVNCSLASIGCAGFVLTLRTGRDVSEFVTRVYTMPEVHFVQLADCGGDGRAHFHVGLRDDFDYGRPVHPENR